jgi:hypothetical protein
MSEEARVYGCIAGAHGSTTAWYDLYSLNHVAVGQLPSADDPPLTREMFAVPMDYRQPGAAFYREQVIHFGGSFNHLSEIWHVWLGKFEGLLRRLYWWEARLHLQGELLGCHEYRWRAVWSGDDVPWYRTPPQPVAKWVFEGGPRDFRVT